MPHKVLLIDDSADIHELVQIGLAGEPVHLVCCADGALGTTMAGQLKPDLILLDVELPGTHGFEVCRILKSHPATAATPIVFLTGASSIEEKMRGLDLGAIDYVTKPFDPIELRARVRAALRTKTLMDALAQEAETLQISEERFRILAENSSDIISRLDAVGAFLYVSPACERLLQYRPEELLGRRMADLVHPDDAARLLSAQSSAVVSRHAVTIEFRLRRLDGAYIWFESTSRAVMMTGGRPPEFHMTSRDVSSRKRVEELDRARARVLEFIAQDADLPEVRRAVIDLAQSECPGTIAAIVLLQHGRLDLTAPGLSPQVCASLEHHLVRLTSDLCSHAATAGGAGEVCDITTDERWNHARDTLRTAGFRACAFALIRSGSGDVMGMLATFSSRPAAEIDPYRIALEKTARLLALAVEHRQLTDQLVHRAHHDALTGLPNRLMLDQRLQLAMNQARETGQHVAMLYIDVDRFKVINDTMGHLVGDILLCQLVQRFQSVAADAGTLARLGGDEFALVIPAINDRAMAVGLGSRILDALKVPFFIGGHELFVTVSLGLSLFPEDGQDGAALQKSADAAMYRAKGGGRNNLQSFDRRTDAVAVERLEMETALRHAIDAGEFELHYQPQADRSGVCGVEALVRWHSPSHGLVPPADFIPLAEETGLILPMGNWIIREAARQWKSWNSRRPDWRIAVNVSALQFAQPDFFDVVRRALADAAMPPQQLELELTESVLMKNPNEAVAKLARLRELGITLAIDDFGTGFSSLAYLQRLPATTLKIDRSFVAAIDDDSSPGTLAGGAAIVRAIISMAQSLGKRVVAEGVETPRQQDFLLSLGCDAMQGYLFGKPGPQDVLLESLTLAMAA